VKVSLFRKLKYRSSLGSNFDEFYRAEFGGEADPDLSVYAADAEQIARLAVEHHGNAGMDPPRYGEFVDVRDLAANPSCVPEGEWFSFTKNAHHQVGFVSFEQVRNLAEELHEQVRDGRKGVEMRSKDELRQYAVEARTQSNSAEWARFLPQAGKKWDKFSRG
jgi:hypothetical protein